MKYEIKEVPQGFAPFQFTVTVETEKELNLWVNALAGHLGVFGEMITPLCLSLAKRREQEA